MLVTGKPNASATLHSLRSADANSRSMISASRKSVGVTSTMVTLGSNADSSYTRAASPCVLSACRERHQSWPNRSPSGFAFPAECVPRPCRAWSPRPLRRPRLPRLRSRGFYFSDGVCAHLGFPLDGHLDDNMIALWLSRLMY